MKQNYQRFPTDFMFQLSTQEFENLKFQFGTPSGGGLRTLLYVFTEQGVTVLSGVLKSPKEIEMNIQIGRAFVSIVSDLIRTAEKSIILIDNYVDDSVLTLDSLRFTVISA